MVSESTTVLIEEMSVRTFAASRFRRVGEYSEQRVREAKRGGRTRVGKRILRYYVSESSKQRGNMQKDLAAAQLYKGVVSTYLKLFQLVQKQDCKLAARIVMI